MPRPIFTPTALEWRLLASACKQLAEKERTLAAQCSGRPARELAISAEEFERIAEKCMLMAKP